jgi:hypothetical protein
MKIFPKRNVPGTWTAMYHASVRARVSEREGRQRW